MILPEGLLDYFELVSVKFRDDQYLISLEEKNLIPKRYLEEKLLSKGFFDEITIQDFPIKGQASFLKVKRRRWTVESTGKIVSRNWDLAAKGIRMTEEFAYFLKGIRRN